MHLAYIMKTLYKTLDYKGKQNILEGEKGQCRGLQLPASLPEIFLWHYGIVLSQCTEKPKARGI